MRRVGLITVLAVVLTTVFVLIFHQQSESVPEDILKQSEGSVTVDPVFKYRQGLPEKSDEMIVDELIGRIEPGMLERWADGESSSTNGYYNLRLYSGWVPALSNLPQTSLRVRYNPETDTYEFLGAEFEFEAGVGAGYEEDPESGETRGYIQFRKSF